MVGALLLWLVLYVALMALTGFAAVVLRGPLERDWSYPSILRVASAVAFFASLGIWLLIVLAG